jgi:hypothetical protein
MFKNPTRMIAGAALSAAASLAVAQPQLTSPVRAVEPGAFREVALDQDALAALLAAGGEVTLAGFPMPGDREVELRVEPFEVLTPDASVVIATAEGEVEVGLPEVSLFHGTVVGEPDSRVYLSFSEFGANGLIQSNGSTAVLSSAGFGAGLPTVIADLTDFPEPPEFAKGWECHVGPEHINPLGLDLAAMAGDGSARANPCRIARIAIEGDYEYTAWLFGGSTEASAAYAVTLLGAINEIYTRDLNVRLLVPYIRLWEVENDPYDGDKLSQFRNEWNANMTHVDRELAHLLSGNYGGGVAWVSVLCHSTYGYGLSGVGGSFPYPLRDHDGGNWDLMVVAHEIGHNFGTLHTHDGYDPHIDDCGNGDCSLAWGGTIMSYCHTCAGGMTNIVLAFHPRVIAQISAYMDGACNILGDNRAFAYDDQTAALADTPARLDVLANDLPINCVVPEIYSVLPFSAQGGTAQISHGTGEGGRDEVLYTPPAGYVGTDSLDYLIRVGQNGLDSATAAVGVLALRQADNPAATRAGARVEYYALAPSDQQLPDFDALTPYAFDLLPEINFPASNGVFATSGRTSYVGAVFEVGVLVPQTGLYTLYLNSDEGSRLRIDGQTVVENDGLHGMTERSGTLGLAAGLHLLRIEYFERSGSQGLIASIEGPEMPKQVVPADMWRSAKCVGDWLLDGSVNTLDFIAFLNQWGAADPAADLDANGLVNTSDVIRFLGAWAAGCP